LSAAEPLFYLTPRLPRLYKRHYSFELVTPERTLKNLDFSVPGHADRIPAHRGDVISILYTAQGLVQKLAGITNHTNGNHYLLATPIVNLARLLPIAGLVLVGAVMLHKLAGVNAWVLLSLGVLGSLISYKLGNLAWLTSPPLEMAYARGQRLLSDQRLLVQRHRISQRISELRHESKANTGLIEQLEALKQKMQQLDPMLYSARLYRSTSAVNILKQQIVNNHRLVREYDRTLKMIDIEVDTSWIADQLPEADDFSCRILERLEELQQIEEQNQTLKYQLAAYEEVNYPRIQHYQADG
jgi:Tfp pilus assembly protein PilN